MSGNSQPVNLNNAAKDGFSKSVDEIRNMASSNMGIIVIIGILTIVLVYVLVYLFRQYNNTSLKTVTMIKKPIKVPRDAIRNISETTGLPSLNNINGKEFSYSMWIYIDGDNDTNTNSDKFILGRVESSSTIDNATPQFTLDKSLNKLYANIKSTENGIDTVHKLTIKYIPYQRWLNIVLVVDNNFIQLFMDGELKEVKDISNYNNKNSIVKNPVGNIFIGSSNNIPSFNGYISKVQVFNYAVTIDHAKVIYKAGPLHKSVLSSIGLQHYGLQNPIYRIDDKDVKECSS